MYKTCSKCKNKKLLSEFSKNKSLKDGYHSQCKECVKEYYENNKDYIRSYKQKHSKSYYILNKEKITEYRQLYREENKEYFSEYYETNKDKLTTNKRTYYEDNKSMVAARLKKYREDNRDCFRFRQAKRRAAKLNALPKWLNHEEFEQIKELYTCAQMFKLYTGQEYHVDHIVPLQGENVCGLHVPWNLQVIPAKENLSKSNKLQEDTI